MGKYKDVWGDYPIYESKPAEENPLLDELCEDKAALIAWFRCNSCYSCAFRKRILPKIDRNVEWCGRCHERHNIVDMVRIMGYSKE